MKSYKKLLCLALVLLLVAAPVTAFAGDYNVGKSNVEVIASGDDQEVWCFTDSTASSAKDSSPVIYGSTEDNIAAVIAANGQIAKATLASVNAPQVVLETFDGIIDVQFSGTSDLGTKDGYVGLVAVGNKGDKDVVYIGGPGTVNASASGCGMLIIDQKVVVTGGTINASSKNGDGIYLSGGSLSVKGGNVNASGKYSGVALYDGSNVSVTNSYLSYGAITATGKNGAFSKDEASQIVIGDNNMVLDANGRDITAEVLKDPSLLCKLEKVTIATKDTAIFPGGDMRSNIHIITAYKNLSFDKVGEPSEEAMKALSAGMNGDPIFTGSYEFTDQVVNHGKFQINIILPQYAGKHVTLVTLVDGQQVTYDRWVANNGTVWCHTDHLGDFAVFFA